MQEGPNAKQHIVEQLKNATNVLVTVSSNPSVDALSAALGLTLMLNKLDKHGTAVFSGAVPPAINFLEPEKTFEPTTDSLRDFIIALDKEKADRLRYKVDGDMVRIYITPYRTNITDKDLEFSQGDFNVEAIVALGVEQREELDKAIAQHGRILHDAAVMTLNTKEGTGNLGAVDWQDTEASSLCEMLVSLSEALQPSLLDEQIGTALLTGIVAATDRFSNELTKPRVMTMAAQLMAAGANQQLIATKLETSHVINPDNKLDSKPDSKADQPESDKPKFNTDGSTNMEENTSSKVQRDEPKKKKDKDPASKEPKDDKPGQASIANTDSSDKAKAAPEKKADKADSDKPAAPVAKPKAKPAIGEMQVNHGKATPADNSPKASRLESDTAGLSPNQIAEKKQKDALDAAEGALAHAMPLSPQSSTFADLERELSKEAGQQTTGTNASAPSQPPTPSAAKDQTTPEVSTQPDTAASPAEEQPSDRKAFIDQPPSWMGRRVEPPTMGGTLNATSEQALKDQLKADEEARNHAMLNHSDQPVNQDQPRPLGPQDSNSLAGDTSHSELPPVAPPTAQSASPTPAAPTPTPFAPADNAGGGDDLNAARDAVHAALGSDASSGMPDYEATPPPPIAPSVPSQASLANQGGDAPAPPPMPDMNTLPPMPPAPDGPPPIGQSSSSSANGPQASPGLTSLNQQPQSDPYGPPPLQLGQNPPGNSPSNNDPGQFQIPGQQ